jgi:hypothetical protein
MKKKNYMGAAIAALLALLLLGVVVLIYRVSSDDALSLGGLPPAPTTTSTQPYAPTTMGQATTTTKYCGPFGIYCIGPVTTTLLHTLSSTTLITFIPIATTTTLAPCPWYNPFCHGISIPLPDIPTTTTTSFMAIIPAQITLPPTTLYSFPLYECLDDNDCDKATCKLTRTGCITTAWTCDTQGHYCKSSTSEVVGRFVSCHALADGSSRCM